MARRSCDGDGLLAAFRAAVRNLEVHVDEVNALNVYPVPDGDTGSNMLATVRAALAEAERAASEVVPPAVGSNRIVRASPTRPSVDRIAAAIAFGSLMGARGNSGVIASQVFRGMADAVAGKRRVNGLDVAHALEEGANRAYGAVTQPVEGTILTVARETAAAAVEAAEHDGDVEAVVGAALDAARRAVATTPSLLPVLREAGVVDAGGEGLLRLVEGALAGLRGEATAARNMGADPTARGDGAAAGPTTLAAHADEGYGYETMFLLEPRPGRSLDVDAIRGGLERLGGSVLVAGDARAVKVHVHSQRPDAVLALGLAFGTLTRISVENLDAQARDGRGRPADGLAAPEPGVASDTVAVLAVVPGDGFAAAFRSFGALILGGGQSDSPSVRELKTAVEASNAREVIVLPNNPNILQVARRVAEVADGVRVHVVPTRNAAEGLAAVMRLDPRLPAIANVDPMASAARAIQSLHVTEAVRDAALGGRRVDRGQTIVLDRDDGLVAADTDCLAAVLAAVGSLTPGFELLTLYYGDGANLAEAEATSRAIGAILPGVDVELVHGGQRHYRYLIAAE